MIWNEKSQFWDNENGVSEALNNIYEDKVYFERLKIDNIAKYANDYSVYLAGTNDL